ncbi:MAG TPA: 5'-nucleotidase C-terminal domain-containing protein, partial [Ignavibacteria bacterium]|nr:5'-nucleotidase C-terminal domain-containing protein [Ignavibacteria bacterium]
VGELKKEGCNLIVMLSHNGYDEDSVFATRHPDLNIIIGGHSHTPIFKPREVNGVLICQAGSYGRYLGKLDIKFDLSDNKITYHFGKLIETVFDSTIYDKSQQQLVENMEQEIKPLLDEVIGTLQSDWKAHGKFGSNLAQWQADIFRQKVNADIGCINTGGVRRDLLKGNITVGDIWEINPFGNTINIIMVNGKMLREMLTNHLVNAYSRQEGKSGTPDLLVFSGLKITVNSSLPVNASSGFIQSLEVNGKPIDDNKEYTISTNNYVAAQSEKFFGKLSASYIAEETNIIDRDAFIEAVKAQKNINSVQEERVIDLNKK